ncbi:MAG: DUF4276 family protein [Cyanobacteria bacterium SID2]|nr:DUF4276 family protein [Cyanobacteria bacterium SID2]MBP0006633.1 DUF4276 family protein [Cyanobacteria bacterium SBC]
MVRLYLFVEGQTELTFADTLLKPHLAQYGVFMHSPRLIAHARKKGRVHRGEFVNYIPMKNDILRSLQENKNSDVFFTTMLDLFRMPPEFPGFDQSTSKQNQPFDRVEFLEECFAEDIGDRRFIPYIQLHEYEACLFFDPTGFEYFYPKHDREIEALKTIASQYETPEFINDGQETSPSQRIIEQFPNYKKRLYGSDLAELIGLPVIRQKCPHFDSWLSRLESLNQTQAL